jgi:hypothetical protein
MRFGEFRPLRAHLQICAAEKLSDAAETTAQVENERVGRPAGQLHNLALQWAGTLPARFLTGLLQYCRRGKPKKVNLHRSRFLE